MIHSFLLIGQSNAGGRGLLTEAEPLDNCDGDLLQLRNGLWVKMFRPVNPDRKTSGVCLAETFAKAYHEAHPEVQVGIIPCADGGTEISQWQPGQILFDNAVHCARMAQRTSCLKGILWHQGESDCQPEQIPLYLEKLRNMIDGLRQELGLPGIPVLVGGLGDFLSEYGLVHYGSINEALMFCAGSDENCAFVPADGLSANPDNLHFSASALQEFGYRYFDAFRSLPCYADTFVTDEKNQNQERSAIDQL